MTTANATMIIDITANAVILDDIGVTTDSCVRCSDQYE